MKPASSGEGIPPMKAREAAYLAAIAEGLQSLIRDPLISAADGGDVHGLAGWVCDQDAY
jgi:hypothetical protein